MLFISFTALEVDASKESFLDVKTIVFYTLVSIPVAFTIFGLIYMFRTKSCDKIREICKCKCCCVDLEKEDKNLDYGNYYYDDDGERRQDVMEVAFDINSINKPEYDCFKMKKTFQALDRNPAYETTEKLTTDVDCKDLPSNSVDPLDDYDYMGNHEEYDYMGN